MTSHNQPAVRRLARVLACSPALLPLIAAPALAEAPANSERVPPISALHAVLLLGGVPVLLFAAIFLAVYLPSMTRGERYTPGLAWHNRNEWFGGPDGGLATSDQGDPGAVPEPEHDPRGGASARW